MSDPSARTFGSDFKRFFLRGLAILLPSVLTLWIVVKAYQFVDQTIAEPINHGVRLTMMNAAPLWEPLRDWFDPTPAEVEDFRAQAPAGSRLPSDAAITARLRGDRINEWWAARWYMDLIGLVVAIVAVYVAGRLLGGFIGKSIYRRLERFIITLPVFKQVYPYVKQIVDFLFGEEKQIKFSRVVVVQYPREGIWSIGFLTGDGMRSIAACAGDAVTVFIPSSPTPFTGYTIAVPRRDVIDMPLTVEEAIRYVVSGGVLIPTHQAAAGSPRTEPFSTMGAPPRLAATAAASERAAPRALSVADRPEDRREAG